MCVCTKKMIFSVELINISTTFHDNHFLFSMCAHTKNPSHWPSCTAQLYSKLCVCMYVRACVCVLDIWSPELVLYNWDFVPLEDLSEPPSASEHCTSISVGSALYISPRNDGCRLCLFISCVVRVGESHSLCD